MLNPISQAASSRLLFPAFVLSLLLISSSQAATSSGTGFFISSEGYIATNFHVVEDAVDIHVRDGKGEVLEAKVVLRDVANDLAILKVVGRGFPVLPIRKSKEVKKGADVFTIGFPNVSIQGRESKVTQGIVSSLSGIAGEPSSFQITVPIQPGNSGGPLIDMTGAVVGLTTAKLSASTMLKRGSSLPENVNYAVKSNYLLELIGSDRNLSKIVQSAASTEKTQPLIALVERAENAVVFILASSTAGQLTVKPEIIKEGEAPRYAKDAQALELFQRGISAYKRQEYKEAISSLGKAAELGNSEAQFVLGNIYKAGQGVPKDDIEAVKWYRLSAKQGNANAQSNLGSMYADGQGVPKDDVEAVKWYRLSAKQGNAYGQSHLGEMSAAGRGVPKDDAEAAKWFRLAATQGLAYAQRALGILYASGRGVPKDDVEAVKWYRLAAEQSYALGQLNLGFMYEHGRGVPKDDVEAVKWYRLAAAQGDGTAKNRLKELGF